ncbi:MAG: DUF4097 family beta strand repeat-containing protein [Chloroflexi bacterium OHK40]
MNVEHEPRTTPAAPQAARPEGIVPNEPCYRRGEQLRRWGALLLLVGVVWLVFELTARGPVFGGIGGFVEQREPIPAQSFNVRRVVVSGVGDEIELVAARDAQVTLSGVERGFGWNGDGAAAALERLHVVAEERGDTLVIEVRRPTGLGGIIGRAPFAELRVALPEGVAAEASVVSGSIDATGIRGDLRLSSVSGAIEAERTAGSLAVNTTSGDVELRDHTGPLVVESVSGDVRASGALERPRVETVSGDVELSGVRGATELHSISGDLGVREAADASLTAESTSGAISFEGWLASGASNHINNISGDVDVRLERPADLRLEASTISGDLQSNLPLNAAERERRRLSGTLGVGDTSLTISTTSGDIEVDND